MKKRKVVSSKNRWTPLPVWPSLTTWLMLDRFQPDGWVWGVCGTIFFFIWVIAVVDIFTREEVELFKTEE